MMKELKKHVLDFELTLKYVQDNLSDGKTLSLELLNLINFFDGYFFTLLPDATIEGLYNFKSGGILPQIAEEEYFISGKRATYSIIPTIQNEVSDFIFQKVKKSTELSCVFEEILDSPKSPQLTYFRKHNLLYIHENQVYYLIEGSIVKYDAIIKCVEKSNAIWHSLCVLTTADFSHLSNENLTLGKIKEVCLGTELIILGAYDGEGYIFWEKKDKVSG